MINAFPSPWDPNGFDDKGITIRDYFAAKILQAAYASGVTYKSIAQEAYRMADEMIEQRAL